MLEGIRLRFKEDGTAEASTEKPEEKILECLGVPCKLLVEIDGKQICAAVQKNVWSVYRQEHACPRRNWYRDTKTGIIAMKSWVGNAQDPVDGHGDDGSGGN